MFVQDFMQKVEWSGGGVMFGDNGGGRGTQRGRRERGGCSCWNKL